MPRFPLLLVLALLPFSALAAIRVSTERELTARQTDLTAFDQTSANIATDGVSFMTVWSDNGDILGARLAPNGTTDGDAFVIAANGEGESLPEIAWGIDRYLAVWQTTRGIRGRFIERDGTMGGIFDIAQRQPGYSPAETQLAFNGSVFLVMWRESIWRGAIVDPSGHKLNTFAGPMTRSDTDLAVQDETFYFAYVDSNDTNESQLFLLPIDGSGQPGMPLPLAPPSGWLIEKIHIATRHDDMLVAWSSAQAVHNVRVIRGKAGEVESVPVGFMWLENIVVDGAGFVLVYGNNDTKLARRAGSPVAAPFPVNAPTLTIMSDTATNGSHSVAILRRFNAFDTHGGDLFTLNFGDPLVRPFAVAPRHQEFADVATAGDISLVTWLEHRTTERKFVVMGMLSRSAVAPATALGGSQSGGFATALLELGAMPVRSAPSVVSNGDGWLVAWASDRNLYAVRVAHDGTLLDPKPLQIATFAIGEVAVTWDGMSYIVAYGAGVKVVFGISVVRVQADGSATLVLGGRAMLPATGPSAATGPNGTLILWNTINGIEGVLLSHSDVVTPLAFPKNYGLVRSAAWNGDTFLVATSDAKSLRWLRVDASGNVSEPGWSIEITLPLSAVRVSPFGDAFLLLWKDPWLRAAIVDRNGQLAGGPTPIGPRDGSVAAAENLIVTTHPIGHPSRAISRVFLQSIDWSPQPNPKQRSARF